MLDYLKFIANRLLICIYIKQGNLLHEGLLRRKSFVLWVNFQFNQALFVLCYLLLIVAKVFIFTQMEGD